MLLAMAILITTTFIASQKAKIYIVQRIVVTKILSQISLSEEWIIQGYNLFYAFVIIPIFLMAFSLFTNQPLEYSLIYSIIIYASSFVLL